MELQWFLDKILMKLDDKQEKFTKDGLKKKLLKIEDEQMKEKQRQHHNRLDFGLRPSPIQNI